MLWFDYVTETSVFSLSECQTVWIQVRTNISLSCGDAWIFVYIHKFVSNKFLISNILGVFRKKEKIAV